MASDTSHDGFEPQDIRETLERVLDGAQFKAAPALATFLKYVVEETLDGRGDRLKAYSIAVEALGRAADFDPQSDPIVRIQAGRLRKALALHFNGEGADEAIAIELPSGGYVPRLIRRRDAVGTQTWRAALPYALLAVAAAAAFFAILWHFASDSRDVATAPQAPVRSPLPTVRVALPTVKKQSVGIDAEAYGQALEAALTRFDETVVVDRASNDAAIANYEVRVGFSGSAPITGGVHPVN